MSVNISTGSLSTLVLPWPGGHNRTQAAMLADRNRLRKGRRERLTLKVVGNHGDLLQDIPLEKWDIAQKEGDSARGTDTPENERWPPSSKAPVAVNEYFRLRERAG